MIRIAVAILVMTLSGCAIFDGGKVPKTTLAAYESSGTPKPSVSYSSKALGGMSSVKELPEAGQNAVEKELRTVLESSRYFDRVAKRDASSDITVDVTLTDSGSPAAMVPAIITGLSLYTIPSWATANFKMIAKVSRKDGLQKEYTLNDSATLVQWLPMMFVFPVKGFSVIPDIRMNMYKKVLSDMKTDGFFANYKNTLSLAEKP